MYSILYLCAAIHTPQAKQEYQKVMIQLMEERLQHEAAVAEYKQVKLMVLRHTHCLFSFHLKVFQQLDEGHQKQQEELSQELLEVKVKH